MWKSMLRLTTQVAGISAWLHVQDGFGMDTAFALITAGLVLYAMFVFVGPRAAFDDLLRPVEQATNTEGHLEALPELTDQAA